LYYHITTRCRADWSRRGPRMTITAEEAGTDPCGAADALVTWVRLSDGSSATGRAKSLIPDGLGRGVVARMAERFADDEKHAAPAIGSW
jgi:hypothetical protein